MQFQTPKDRIIVALDVSTMREVERLVGELAPHVGIFKIGLQLMHRLGGPQVVSVIHALGGHVMYDAKLHDIPETMSQATKAIADLEVAGFTFHACSGRSGIHAAHQNAGKSLAIGVTVLTSHNAEECTSVFGAQPQKKVFQFAAWMADEAATNDVAMGIVCSPMEIPIVRSLARQPRHVVITPGIRPSWAATDDQKRFMTPGAAIRSGGDMVVIGRPILRPPPEIGSPVEAAQLIAKEIENALQRRND